MVVGELLRIPVADLHPSPFQKRRKERDSDLADLASSIASQDVIEPLVARRRLAGGFELMAGHRRHRAAQLAGVVDVPVIVREASDGEAAAVVVAENLHRRDLSPMEEASAIDRLLREWRGDAAAVAAELGVAPSFIATRARLRKLAPCWRSAAEDPQSVVSAWSAAHLEVLARLERSTQEAIFEELRWAMPARPTVQGIARLVDGHLRAIGQAGSWQHDDETLPGGSCKACPKRSSQQRLLFPRKRGIQRDLCLDKSCWDRKSLTALQRTVEEVDKLGAPVLLVHRGDVAPDDVPGLAGRSVPLSTVRESPTGQLAIVVDGSQRGEMIRVDVGDVEATASAQRTADVARHLRRIVADMVEAIGVDDLERSGEVVLAAVAAFGCRGVEDPWVAFDRYRDGNPIRDAWEGARRAISRRVSGTEGASAIFDVAARAAAALGFNLEDLVAQAEHAARSTP